MSERFIFIIDISLLFSSDTSLIFEHYSAKLSLSNSLIISQVKVLHSDCFVSHGPVHMQDLVIAYTCLILSLILPGVIQGVIFRES